MQLTIRERVKRKLGHSVMIKPQRVRLDQGTLSICFDDFPQSAWTVAGPILAEHGVHATYFVSGSMCGQIIGGLKYFTERDLQEVWASGHEIGCHTFDHFNALKVPVHAFAESIERNRVFFSERLEGVQVENFAFPYNAATIGTKLLVARMYKLARGIGDKLNSGLADFSELASFNLSLVFPIPGFAQNGPAYDLPLLVEKAAQERKWLVVYTHDISDDPTEHGNRARDLEELIVRSKNAGLAIKSLREVVG